MKSEPFLVCVLTGVTPSDIFHKKKTQESGNPIKGQSSANRSPVSVATASSVYGAIGQVFDAGTPGIGRSGRRRFIASMATLPPYGLEGERKEIREATQTLF